MPRADGKHLRGVMIVWRREDFIVCFVETVDDNGKGAVSGDVAGGAEIVHGDVEGNHECLFGFAEAEHGLEDAQGGHDGTAGYTRGGYHDDAEHEDEVAHGREVDGHAAHEHDGNGAGHDFERAAGEVDGGTKGDDKAGYILVYLVTESLLQGDGDGGGRGLGAQGSEVSRHHAPEQQQGILPRYEPGHAVLQQQDADVQQEDDTDDLEEYAQ